MESDEVVDAPRFVAGSLFDDDRGRLSYIIERRNTRFGIAWSAIVRQDGNRRLSFSGLITGSPSERGTGEVELKSQVEALIRARIHAAKVHALRSTATLMRNGG